MSKDQSSRLSRFVCAGGYFVVPYLLAAGFTAGILAGDPLSIPPLPALLMTIGYVLVGVSMIHIVALAAVRATPARELIVCAVIAFVGMFGYVQLRMQNVLPPMHFLLVWSIAFAALGWLIWQWRNQEWLAQAGSFVGFAALALIAMQAYQIGEAHIHDQHLLAEMEFKSPLAGAAVRDVPQEKLPDVYYLVLDAYGRGDVLRQLYNYDNAEFLNALRERGFFVADQSRANYHLTELSVASSLNMTELSADGLAPFKTRAPLRRMIQQSAVAEFLGQQGYKTVAFASGKADTECRDFDRYVDPSPALSIYQDVLLHTTAIPKIIETLPAAVPRPADWHRRRIVRTLEEIPTAGNNAAAPEFVFAHLMSPHPPFVFDAEGNAVDGHGQYLVADGPAFLSRHAGDRQLYRQSYVDQVQHLNDQLIAMIDRILAHDRDAVIILQGDHGPRSEMNFESHEDANLVEALGILNAIRLPGGEDSGLYASISPVNNFRVVLNHLFATDLKRLPDRSFFETEAYTFVDVTDATVVDRSAINSFGSRSEPRLSGSPQ